MENNTKIDLSNFKIEQFGYVYKDIEKQARIMESKFNMPKFNILPPFTGSINYRGKKTEITVKLGFSRNFNLQIEFIQLIEGECAYKEFLDQGKEGLQHISFYTENTESYIEHFTKLGYEVVQSGVVPGGRIFAYFDTEDALGIMLEMQGPKRRRKT